MQEKLEPLFKACVWPRWLLLEAAFDHAANSGDLQLSALILRSQIEELDALRTVATVLSCREQGSWDSDVMASAFQTLTKRVLPRLQTKTDEQLIEQATDTAKADTRPEPLQRAFDRLSEYVHPNYGSHVLSVRPHSVEAAMVFIEAFVAVYEAFLSLPWAKDADDTTTDPTQKRQADSRDPYIVMVDDTIPTLKPAFLGVRGKTWDDAAECFRHRAACENNWAALADLPTDVEAIRGLNANSVPSDSWPEAFRTVAGQNRYAFLVALEQRLTQDAASIVRSTSQQREMGSMAVLVSSLNFAINVTEYKLDLLARQATRLINAENVLGASLAIRSMIEHHAVAVELGGKLKALWERAEKGAPNTKQVSDALAEAERQIARVLAGSSERPQGASGWRTLWQEIVRKPYNVLGPVKALDTTQPGFLKTYGLLSHIVHGTVCTGGDLLGTRPGGSKPGQPTIAQLTVFLAKLCEPNAMLERQARSMTIASRLDVIRRGPTAFGERIKEMRLLEGQKLKLGRDIFGSGTHADPFRFRVGLLYHDAFHHYLKQQGIEMLDRRLEQFATGFGDRVQTKGGRVLHFLNDNLPLQ